MRAFVDTNVVVRHLTHDPPAAGRRATALLEGADELLLPDLVMAECVYVLESFYEVARPRVAEMMRAAIAMPAVRVVDESLLLRSLELYERQRLDFADAYLVACAELTGVDALATFDRKLARLPSIEVIGP